MKVARHSLFNWSSENKDYLVNTVQTLNRVFLQV